MSLKVCDSSQIIKKQYLQWIQPVFNKLATRKASQTHYY